jgi:hypothetical protein
VNHVNRIPRLPALFLILTTFIVYFGATPSAHEIPADVTVRTFIKPEGQRLRLLVRLPMASIHDIDWPVRKDNSNLDLALVEPFLRQAADVWLMGSVDMYEGSTRLPPPEMTAVRLSLEDGSFGTYETALATIGSPRIPDDTGLLPTQGMLDVLLDYRIQSDQSRFSFHPRFDRFGLRVVTVLRFLTPDGKVRAFEYDEGDPGIVRLDPEWYQAAWNFVKMGFKHILDGPDHLLFLFCLVIPFRRFRALIPVVTAFTVAHSVTLIASAYDMAPGASWFPPFIETLIALSIVYMALENIVVSSPRRRWMMTFGFGLVHGFGFSFALRETLQFAGSHLLTSLLSFNVGVELGQIFVLALMVPALQLAFRYVVAERVGTIILSALATHTAWHWMVERYGVFRRFPITLPVMDAAFFADLMRWLMVAVALAGVMWLINVVRASRERRELSNPERT